MRIFEVLDSSIDEGLYDQHIFKAIAMIGPMGAGKSTIAKKLVGGSGLRSLNLDNFNELLIQKGQVPNGQLSPDQLEKNWQLTQKQKTNWLDGRLGMLIDGSGRNVDGLVKPLKELETIGYDVAVILVNVSLDTSIQRQQSRAAAQAAQYGQGRNVPLDLAKSSHEQIQANIPKYQQIFGKNFFVVNNEGAVDLAKVEKSINQFMSAPPSKPAALQWIKQQQSERSQAPVAPAQQAPQQPAPQKKPYINPADR